MGDKGYRRRLSLLEADVGDDLVALEPTGGTCFGMNSVAKQVWHKLEQTRSFAELKADLTAEYDVSDEQCAAELQELLEDMVRAGLIEPVS